MTSILRWLADNKEWLFSGVGVVFLLVIAPRVAKLVKQWGGKILSWWHRKRQLPDTQMATIPWKGVERRGRYFAWDGPTLHLLDDRAPIPAPEIAIEAIRQSGATPSFGRKDRLRDYSAKGAMQVYETDRETWKRELLYSSDGSQVLLAKETSSEGDG
jgi:hypothetical protein